MSSNYQQKKMMNALGAIDTKGNIVLEQFQDGAPSRMTVLLMTEIPFRIKILIHGCNMNFLTYGLQIA